jgi:phage terminase Nu1 subunit (DNA packaging protein)
MNTNEIAGIFRVTERAVRQWIEQGMPTTSATASGRGMRYTLDLAACAEWYFQRNGERFALVRAQTRLASEQADKTRMDNEVRQADLAEMSVITRVVNALVGRVKKKLTALPRRLARGMEGMDVEQREVMIDQTIRAELENLSAYRPKRGLE